MYGRSYIHLHYYAPKQRMDLCRSVFCVQLGVHGRLERGDSSALLDKHVHIRRRDAPTRALLFLTYISVLACSVLNITLRLWPSPPAPDPTENIALLERPSVYIDLAAIHYGSPFLEKIAPVANFPHVYGLVSAARPDAALLDVRRWLTAFGTVVPDEHHIMVTQDVRALVTWVWMA